MILVLLAALGCSQGPKLIPAKTFAKIYADMFMADAWLESHKEARPVADTTLFYETVFNKYGYTTEDYYHSVSKYLTDPEEYSKILKQASAILDATSEKLRREQEGAAPKDAEAEIELEDLPSGRGKARTPRPEGNIF